MQIIWYGQSCFQLIVENEKKEKISIVIDPFDPKIGLKMPSLKADVLLVSHQHSDHNNKATVSNGYFLIEGPGEYETKGVFFQGIPAFHPVRNDGVIKRGQSEKDKISNGVHDNSKGGERGEITMYVIEAEEMRLCFLSDLGQKELHDKQIEELGEVDILFVPVGSAHSLDAKGASDIIAEIEPRIVIPMHYKLPGMKPEMEPIDKFLKLMGVEKAEPQEKLTIKKKDLPEGETKVIVLKP